MKNLPWALSTASKVAYLVATDDLELVGTYLNDIKECIGQKRFSQLLLITDSFGMSDYQRRKLMREAK